MRWLDSITDSLDTNLGKLVDGERWGGLSCFQYAGSQRVRHGL